MIKYFWSFIGKSMGLATIAISSSIVFASDCEVFVTIDSCLNDVHSNVVQPTDLESLSAVMGGSELFSNLRRRGISVSYYPRLAGGSVYLTVSCMEMSKGNFACKADVSSRDVSSFPPRLVFRGESSPTGTNQGKLADALDSSIDEALSGIEQKLCR